MKKKEVAQPYIIQLERRGEKLNMLKTRGLFKGTGVEIDESFGPILISRQLGRYILRGRATATARAKAENIRGVSFFADPQQQPMP